MRAEVRAAGSSMACSKGSEVHGLLSIHLPNSGALCPMRARGPDKNRRQAAKLQVSRATRQRAPAPSQGGSAGSNPVGATNHHQHNTAADQQKRRSAAGLCVRPSPVRSGCGRVSVPHSCPRPSSRSRTSLQQMAGRARERGRDLAGVRATTGVRPGGLRPKRSGR
jgi:hypothetical protein